MNIVPLHDKSLDKIRQRILKSKFKQNDCFYNALLVSIRNPDVEYVEGLVIIYANEHHVGAFEHAWNKWNNMHFDVTYEQFLTEDERRLVSYKEILMSMSAKEVVNSALVYDTTGPYYNRGKNESQDVRK
jgi:hypothetical protein